MVPEATLIGNESVTLTGSKWLFAPTKRDARIVELERERLGAPGAKVTRSDAIRSLFLRALRAREAELDAELASRDGRREAELLAQLTSRKGKELSSEVV